MDENRLSQLKASIEELATSDGEGTQQETARYILGLINVAEDKHIEEDDEKEFSGLLEED